MLSYFFNVFKPSQIVLIDKLLEDSNVERINQIDTTNLRMNRARENNKLHKIIAIL